MNWRYKSTRNVPHKRNSSLEEQQQQIKCIIIRKNNGVRFYTTTNNKLGKNPQALLKIVIKATGLKKPFFPEKYISF